MQEINAWLRSGKAFEIGKSLYMKYGTNSLFKSLLNTQGPTPYNVKKLGADLKALAPALPAIVNQNEITNPVVDTKTQKTVNKHRESLTETTKTNIDQPVLDSTNTADYPKYLQIKQQIQNLYRQIERNRTELDLNNKTSLLRMIAKQVVSLHGKLTDYWKLVDYYDEHGCFPPVKPTIEEVRAERTPLDEIQLLRQSTSKAKTRLKNPKCRDVEGTNELIKQNNQRIIQLGGKVKA